MRSPLLLIATTAASLLAARAASASPDFPFTVQEHLGLTYEPPCTICHTTDAGGSGTATKPFALAMKERGISAANTPAVAPALDKMVADEIDSDCNDVTDVDQLKAGQDPNTNLFIDGSGKSATESKGCDTATIAYGCGAHAQIAADPAPWEGAAAVAALLGLALARRRRV
jgi:MYXO-CTERM domain-containing protein